MNIMNLAFKTPGRVSKRLEMEFPERETPVDLGLYHFTGGGGSAPPPPDLNAETAGELAAKTAAAPAVFGAEAQYDPQYANLNLADLSDTLLGSPAGTRQQQVSTSTPGFINPQTGAFSTTNPGRDVPFTETGVTNETVNTPASPGLLNLEGQVNTITNQQAAQSQGQQAAGNIGNLNQYGQAGVSALMGLDPQTAQLMQSMTDQAQQGVDAGTGLTPAQMRQVSQTVRQGQADRGLGYGPVDQYQEALGVSQYGTQLQQLRMQQAQSVAAQRSGMYGAPISGLITNAPNNFSAGALNQAYGISSNVGPKLFGSDLNAQDTFNTAYNGAVSQANSGANNSSALIGAGISGGVGLASAGLLASGGAAAAGGAGFFGSDLAGAAALGLLL